MTALTGLNIASTYKDLLQLSHSGLGADATLRAINDGAGNVSSIALSTTGLSANTVVIPFTTVAVVNGANSNVAITGSYVRLTGPSAVFNITGFSYNSATQVDGQLLYIYSTVA
jgi:hypothetical protein